MSNVDRLTEEDYDRFVEDLCSGFATDRTFDVVKKILTLHSFDVLGLSVDSRKYTVFHYIAENNMVELLSFILNNVKQFNPAVDQCDMMNHTPLFVAASLGHLKICQLLIRYGSKALYVRTLDTGEVPLHVAISEKHVDVVSYMIKFTKDVNVARVQQSRRYKPIHLAARVGSIRIAKILFEHGANIDSKSHNHATPLLIAMKHAQYDFATFLVKKGANVTHIYVMQGFITALHCVGNCSELAELLIKKGALIQKPVCDRTAMSYALSGLHIDVLRVFLRNGAVPDKNDFKGCITHDNLDRRRNIIRLLLCYGVPFKNRSLGALDAPFVKKLRGLYNSRRVVSSSQSLLFSPLDRVFLFELARCTAIRLPGVAFRLFHNIRCFVTFHGCFMADGFEFTGSSSLWCGGYDFSWMFHTFD